jgi:hypothetical protein
MPIRSLSITAAVKGSSSHGIDKTVKSEAEEEEDLISGLLKMKVINNSQYEALEYVC